MIHYLTVQDVLWINHAVTRKVNQFKYAQLEEAVFFQYGYGKSENILLQAAGFIEGFIRLRPFSEGNRATAFISVLTFLEINGYQVTLEPEAAYQWAMDIANRKTKSVDAVKAIVTPEQGPVPLKPAIRTEVHDLIERYSEAAERLTD